MRGSFYVVDFSSLSLTLKEGLPSLFAPGNEIQSVLGVGVGETKTMICKGRTKGNTSQIEDVTSFDKFSIRAGSRKAQFLRWDAVDYSPASIGFGIRGI